MMNATDKAEPSELSEDETESQAKFAPSSTQRSPIAKYSNLQRESSSSFLNHYLPPRSAPSTPRSDDSSASLLFRRPHLPQRSESIQQRSEQLWLSPRVVVSMDPLFLEERYAAKLQAANEMNIGMYRSLQNFLGKINNINETHDIEDSDLRDDLEGFAMDMAAFVDEMKELKYSKSRPSSGKSRTSPSPTLRSSHATTTSSSSRSTSRSSPLSPITSKSPKASKYTLSPKNP